MEKIETLNQRLKDTFGIILDGRARYRIVWTTTQTEIRKDTYEVFYGNVYLRTERDVTKEMPKYPFAPDQWALEYHSYEHAPNIMTVNGSYEPVWVFKLYPNWAVLSFTIKAFEGGVAEKLSPSDIKEEEAREIAAEIAEDELEIAEAGRSDLFAFEQSVALNKTDFWRKE